MLTLLRGRNAAVFALLALLMAATRFHHIGSALHLPDASLAVFFVGGAVLPLAGFAALLIGAVGLDVLAMALSDRSGGAFGLGFCFTVTYAMLPVAYAMVWWLGRRCGAMAGWRNGNVAGALVGTGAGWWLAASIAFVLTNGAYYWFSGRYAEPYWAEYTARFGQYYLPYVSRGLPYVAIAGVAAVAWRLRRGTTAGVTVAGKGA